MLRLQMNRAFQDEAVQNIAKVGGLAGQFLRCRGALLGNCGGLLSNTLYLSKAFADLRNSLRLFV